MPKIGSIYPIYGSENVELYDEYLNLGVENGQFSTTGCISEYLEWINDQNSESYNYFVNFF